MRPRLPRVDRVVELLREIDERQVYSNRGPLVTSFEALIADHLQVTPEKVVVCASATLGLQGACSLMPVDTFVVPAFTFPASALSVINAGATLIPADIDPDSWQVDPRAGVDPASVGLLRVLPFGAPVNLDRFRDWTYVVIDAAASMGSGTRNLSDLPGTWAVAFSLHATKVLGMGEGGVVVFGSSDMAASFRAWINFGFSGSREPVLVGTNAKMSEFGAAYGIAAFRDWADEESEWLTSAGLAHSVDKRLGLTSQVAAYPGVSPYWIVEFTTPDECTAAEEALAASGIGTRRWWGRGCHEMPALRGFFPGPYPVTDRVASTTLGLPMFRGMTERECRRVGDVLDSLS